MANSWINATGDIRVCLVDAESKKGRRAERSSRIRARYGKPFYVVATSKQRAYQQNMVIPAMSVIPQPLEQA